MTPDAPAPAPMTPTEIKMAYKASLDKVAALTATKDDLEKSYGAACATLHEATVERDALKLKLDECIAAGTI